VRNKLQHLLFYY